ncbi:hypothetical protein HELRODRAFT_176736 [Helobdella robusta]|uniref:Uncharacterized protein n=1 Tax=Helobdella robusta TaxID=6412 RepID=T1FAU9_HELRO|nr:hypothetical protein HELRODRAFT_176736 [Helobdella robusta]ESN99568.1 hypothetical protein HELRODRAFT_176736 [Helobdella robusta]
MYPSTYTMISMHMYTTAKRCCSRQAGAHFDKRNILHDTSWDLAERNKRKKCRYASETRVHWHYFAGRISSELSKMQRQSWRNFTVDRRMNRAFTRCTRSSVLVYILYFQLDVIGNSKLQHFITKSRLVDNQDGYLGRCCFPSGMLMEHGMENINQKPQQSLNAERTKSNLSRRTNLQISFYESFFKFGKNIWQHSCPFQNAPDIKITIE